VKNIAQGEIELKTEGANIRHVLIIEDEPNIIEALSFIFFRDGWKVDAHSDGANAVTTTIQTGPNAIILDVMLPNKSGFEILEELREVPEYREIPILMLTARGQTKDRELALAKGATRFIIKPFSNSEVLRTMNELVGREQ
jgi:two-component system OmpR family response regulator|tara:strand:- start:80 stop:502 length:423 start_codon:yes stop_codon:yes gene_type:complete